MLGGGQHVVGLVEALKGEKRLLDDHVACSKQARDEIRAAFNLLTGAGPDGTTSHAESVHLHLATLMQESHRQMTTVHHTKVERRWRRLYTDAALLKALLLLSLDNGQNDEQAKLDGIRDLDMAIIVAGVPGQGRADLVHRAIVALQSRLTKVHPELRHVCKPNPPAPAIAPTIRATKAVKELPELPGISAYMRICHQQPFVVRGAASDWPALQPYGDDEQTHVRTNRWASAAYLERISGPGRVVPIEIGSDYTADDWTQSIVSWSDFLTRGGWCDGASSDTAAAKHYLAQHDVFAQFPALLHDVRMPDLVYAGPPAPFYHADYKPPIDAEDGTETVLLNAWLGPQDTVSPAHRDPYYNCYTQVVGYKLVWIAPYDAPIDTSDGVTAASMNVFDPPASYASSDQHFSTCIEPQATYTILSPGDVLVMPPGWFHALKSLTRSFSVSMWF